MIFIIPLIFGAMAVLTGGAGVLAGLDGMANEEEALTKAVEYQARIDIEIDRIIAIDEFLVKVQDRICEVANLASELDDRSSDILKQLEARSFDIDRDVATFQRLALLMKALKQIMDTPILRSNGELNSATANFLNSYSNL